MEDERLSNLEGYSNALKERFTYEELTAWCEGEPFPDLCRTGQMRSIIELKETDDPETMGMEIPMFVTPEEWGEWMKAENEKYEKENPPVHMYDASKTKSIYMKAIVKKQLESRGVHALEDLVKCHPGKFVAMDLHSSETMWDQHRDIVQQIRRLGYVKWADTADKIINREMKNPYPYEDPDMGTLEMEEQP